MDSRPPITPDDLREAVASFLAALRPAAEKDWTVPAGTLTWSCWRAADHVGACLVSYAAQLAVQQPTRYVCLDARADHDATPAEVLECVEAGGELLAAQVRVRPPQARAFHPYGTSDPEGFTGMGCVEVLVHGHDIAAGLGLPFDPPREVCRRVMARMFPGTAGDQPHPDPWAELLWATGRASLPGREPVTSWRWHGAPLDG